MDVLLVNLALALVLGGIGWWGRGNADRLVSESLPSADRGRKVRALRRGGGFCYLLALAFVISGLVALT
ncbi:hypothetical protein ASG90_06950 [Nocardioides sp. Soil797]|nr:hypothetical protein ASG90_06950 [Nocardioides sp. Soil797]